MDDTRCFSRTRSHRLLGLTRLVPANCRSSMIHTLTTLAVAATTDAERDEANRRLLWAGLLLVAVLLLGAALLAWLERWRKRMTDSSAATSVDQFTSFRLSYERGELSEEEYRRIQQKLSGKPKPPAPKPLKPSSSEPKEAIVPPATNP